MNIFDKYIEEGRNKSESAHNKLKDIENILFDLSNSLDKYNVKLDFFSIRNNRGVGFQTIILSEFLNKNFISITIGYNDENIYILEYNGEVTINRSIDELINSIGNIISSSTFWQDIDKLKMINMKNT